MKSLRQDRRIRIFSAVILLMVMMLQVGVKTLHQHDHVEKEHISCDDCQHHRVHSGHILNWVDDGDDCDLCQLFSSPYCESKNVRLNLISVEHDSYCICYTADVFGISQMQISLRAPPVSLL